MRHSRNLSKVLVISNKLICVDLDFIKLDGFDQSAIIIQNVSDFEVVHEDFVSERNAHNVLLEGDLLNFVVVLLEILHVYWDFVACVIHMDVCDIENLVVVIISP